MEPLAASSIRNRWTTATRATTFFRSGRCAPRTECSAAASWIASASPGDPLTPGIGATPDAKRLPLKDAKSITKIPVLPISYGDAQPLLAALAGPMAPDEWRGSLPIPYHVGAGPAQVHLKVAFNWNIKPVYDVIAKIPGSVAPD